MPLPAPRPLERLANVTPAQFVREIAPAGCPAILAGCVADWPVVRAATRSAEDFLREVGRRDTGHPIDALLMRPDAHGRVGYDADMQGFNFLHNKLPLQQLIQQLWRYHQLPVAPGLAIQSARIADCMPSFFDDHAMPFAPPRASPRLWIGNRVVTPAHFDESNNLACVVAGRRRFTLFPAEQIGNLYIGPLDFAPTGTPMSLVDFNAPDLERFPRFAEAMAHALVAELEPGDALYLPSLWWHHVESLDPINGLVNYWWRGMPDQNDAPDTALPLLHQAIRDLARLPAHERDGWRALFDHYVFDADDDTYAHLPTHRRGLSG